MTSSDLEAWVLRVMQDELVARQADAATRDRDQSGHPSPIDPPHADLLRAA